MYYKEIASIHVYACIVHVSSYPFSLVNRKSCCICQNKYMMVRGPLVGAGIAHALNEMCRESSWEHVTIFKPVTPIDRRDKMCSKEMTASTGVIHLTSHIG